MGHIVARKRRDGSAGFTAQIVLKRGGKVIHREAQTFDRRQAANAWMVRREDELSKPGAIERERQRDNDPRLGDVIDRSIAESQRVIGRTKAQVLRKIKEYDIVDLRCSQITSADIVAFARALPSGPATRQNYLSHLGAVFAIARPAWGYPLDQQVINDAFAVTKRLGVTAKGRSRNRRPTLDELEGSWSISVRSRCAARHPYRCNRSLPSRFSARDGKRKSPAFAGRTLNRRRTVKPPAFWCGT